MKVKQLELNKKTDLISLREILIKHLKFDMSEYSAGTPPDLWDAKLLCLYVYKFDRMMK